jgi:hypothetical protein
MNPSRRGGSGRNDSASGRRLSPDEALQVGSAIFGLVLAEPAGIAEV